MIRAAGTAFFERSRKWFTWLHLKIFTAILRCRTSALGGHVDECSRCGHRAISFNSCRNRHCPKCQANARDRWLEARRAGTSAHPLCPRGVHAAAVSWRRWLCRTSSEIYGLLFRASAETLLTSRPRSKAPREPRSASSACCTPGIRNCCTIRMSIASFRPADWQPITRAGFPRRHDFFLPVKVLGRVFRGKFVAGLRELHAAGKLGFHGTSCAISQAPQAFAAMLRPLFRSDWVVYSKRPFGGAEHALRYLGCYTHRVAISNHRLVSLADGHVTFRWRDSAHKNKKRLMSLTVEEFLRRFFLHVLPRGFVRIRHFGLFAHRRRAALLPLCLQLLAATGSPTPAGRSEPKPDSARPLWLCPQCGGPMVLLERLNPLQARLRSPPQSLKERP